MANKRATEVPEENELLLNELMIAMRLTEEKITGRSHDEKRDETHTSTRKTKDETVMVSCPLVSLKKKESGESVSLETAEEIATQHGFSDVKRTDWDVVE